MKNSQVVFLALCQVFCTLLFYKLVCPDSIRWVWVVSPFWIPVVIWVLFGIVAVTIMGGGNKNDKRR